MNFVSNSCLPTVAKGKSFLFFIAVEGSTEKSAVTERGELCQSHRGRKLWILSDSLFMVAHFVCAHKTVLQ